LLRFSWFAATAEVVAMDPAGVGEAVLVATTTKCDIILVPYLVILKGSPSPSTLSLVKTLVVALATVTMLVAGCVTVTRVEPAASTSKADVGHFETLATSIVFSPDGTMFATAANRGSGSVRLWNTATMSEQSPLEEPRRTGAPVCFSPDGQLLAVVARDADTLTQVLEVFDVATRRRVASYGLQRSRFVSSASFSRGGKAILFVETEPHFRVLREWYQEMWLHEWDFEGGQLRSSEGPIEIEFMNPVLSPDGKLLTYARRGVDRLEFWDMTSRRQQATMEGPYYGYTVSNFPADPPIIFSPDGARIAKLYRRWGQIIETTDGRVRQISYQDTRAHTPPGAFSPDGRMLAVQLLHEGFQLLDASTGKALASVRESNAPVFTWSNEVTALTFSPDGRKLVASTISGKVQVWEVSKLNEDASVR
jgi:WD40 repeat protein